MSVFLCNMIKACTTWLTRGGERGGGGSGVFHNRGKRTQRECGWRVVSLLFPCFSKYPLVQCVYVSVTLCRPGMSVTHKNLLHSGIALGYVFVISFFVLHRFVHGLEQPYHDVVFFYQQICTFVLPVVILQLYPMNPQKPASQIAKVKSI